MTRRWYRLLHGKHARTENGAVVTYRWGDRILMTPAEAATHATRLEDLNEPEVVDPIPAPEPEIFTRATPAPPPASEVEVLASVEREIAASTREATDWTETLEDTVPNVLAIIAAVDDPADLADIRAAEVRGKNRKMILAAIDRR